MPTVVLNIMSVAFPSIENRIRASVFLQSDPMALIASQIDAVFGHPARIWSFPGLQRTNYGFKVDEIDIDDNVVRNIAFFDVVPSEIDGSLNRDDEQIQVGSTPGFDTGANSFIFDGTETAPGSGIFKPDYRGWQIVPSELTERGILVRDSLDYSWNKDTGEFQLLQTGDLFTVGTYYNIHFNPQSNPVGNSYPSVTDFTIRVVTADDNITVNDFANKIIIEQIADYIELSLPDISTIPQGRKVMIEMSQRDTMCCAKVISSSPIKFLRGNIFIIPGESISIYRFKREDESNEWRAFECDGNFRNCGELASDDLISANVFNKHPLDGESVLTERYARIYNEIVLNLPIMQRVNYDDWISSPEYYSLDNSSNPSATGHFHFPDRRGYFEKNNETGASGDAFDAQVGEFTDNLLIPKTSTSQGEDGQGLLTTGSGPNEPLDPSPIPITLNSGKDNFPAHYLINKYVLV